MLGKKKDEKDELTEGESFKLIREWGDLLLCPLKDDDFEAVQDEIWKMVSLKRLTYDVDKDEFSYVLIKPIEKKDDSGEISMLKIREVAMENKRDFFKHKNEVDKAASMYQTYCTDSEGNEIGFGFLTRIFDRDQKIMNAVILGFFLQIVPGVK